MSASSTDFPISVRDAMRLGSIGGGLSFFFVLLSGQFRIAEEIILRIESVDDRNNFGCTPAKAHVSRWLLYATFHSKAVVLLSGATTGLLGYGVHSLDYTLPYTLGTSVAASTVGSLLCLTFWSLLQLIIILTPSNDTLLGKWTRYDPWAVFPIHVELAYDCLTNCIALLNQKYKARRQGYPNSQKTSLRKLRLPDTASSTRDSMTAHPPMKRDGRIAFAPRFTTLRNAAFGTPDSAAVGTLTVATMESDAFRAPSPAYFGHPY